jgi:hypothetical protein
MAFWIGFMFFCEWSLRFIIAQFAYVHPILENERNRQVLSRHIGTDFVACALCAWTGCQALSPHLDTIRARFWDSSVVIDADYKTRLWAYIPGAHNTLLMFAAYQVKNLSDTFVWNDGALFVVHHVLSFLAAWGAMYPGCGHTYALFYMGVSEISTTVLVILANFDDDLGVMGLADAFPNLRMFWAVAFALTFIVCRTIMWPFVSCFTCKDLLLAAWSPTDTRAAEIRGWLYGFVAILVVLTQLQFLWLGQIFYMGWVELGGAPLSTMCFFEK